MLTRSPEFAAACAKIKASAQERERATRRLDKLSAFSGWLSLGMALTGVLFAVCVPTQWNALAPLGNLLVCWMNYRMCRSCRQCEPLWREVAFHAQRMWVESPERALWHSEQIDRTLDELKKLT